MVWIFVPFKIHIESRYRWLTPVILATQEAEISRILVRSQPREIPCKTLSQKRAAGVVEGEGPEFKSQYQKKKKDSRWNVIAIVTLLRDGAFMRG
jgi:hypothetical protein